MTTTARVVGGSVLVTVNLGPAAALADMSPRGRAAFIVERFAEAEIETAAFLDNGAAPTRTLSSLSASPTCSGCGTSVERAGQRCAACTMKDQSRGGVPTPRMALVSEGEPAYKTTGNFRDAQRPNEEIQT